MLNLIFGKALYNWLEKLADIDTDPQASSDLPPAPDFSPAQPTLDLTCYTIVPSRTEDNWQFPKVERRAMGSLFEIYLVGSDRDAVIGAGEATLDEIQRLDRQLSHYQTDSDISQINANASKQWVRIEPALFQLLQDCKSYSDLTEGAFDITSANIAKAWGFHDGNGRIPSDTELNALLSATGYFKILYDYEDQLVYFSHPDLSISLAAVGKGYALDRAASHLKMFGVERALLHGGQSSIYALGSPPGKRGWELTIKDPREKTPIQKVLLKNQALSTSGNYEQYFEIDGKRFTHIFDPLTAKPVEGMVSVSVISNSAAESDALSTGFFVLGKERTTEICHTRPDLRVIMMEETPDGDLEITKIGFE